MSNIRFVWDSKKNEANIRKHKVSFFEARSVFHDENAQLIADPDHSIDEERFILLGQSAKSRILIVCHCYRENDDLIRIISARKATMKERRSYPR